MIDPSPGTAFYLDASALVKRYVTETGSPRIIALCHPSTDNTVVTAQITQVEAAAAFASKYRNGGLSLADYQSTLEDLAYDFAHQYLLVRIDQPIVDLAVNLTKRQKLRGYDAVQLAAALTLNSILARMQFSSLTFVAADSDLLEAAQSEGLSVENPSQYP